MHVFERIDMSVCGVRCAVLCRYKGNIVYNNIIAIYDETSNMGDTVFISARKRASDVSPSSSCVCLLYDLCTAQLSVRFM